MKSTFKKQRRGSKKNKSQRKSQRRRRHMKGGQGKFYTGTYKGITKICPEVGGLKSEKCLYIVPKMLEKGITGKGFWNANTWENINNAVDNNLEGKMKEYFDSEELMRKAKALELINNDDVPIAKGDSTNAPPSGAEEDVDLIKFDGGKKRHRKQKKSRKYRK